MDKMENLQLLIETAGQEVYAKWFSLFGDKTGVDPHVPAAEAEAARWEALTPTEKGYWAMIGHSVLQECNVFKMLEHMEYLHRVHRDTLATLESAANSLRAVT